MQKRTFSFSNSSVDYYIPGSISQLKDITDQKNTVLIIDENVYAGHARKFKGWNSIVLKSGEQYKVQATVDSVIEQLIAFEADRKTTLVGIGGGVITDLTGFIASIYMRGIPFGFIPTTLLSMVDASIGGKNGIDRDVYKNIVGIIRQPLFILHDYNFLKSLPHNEWRNGFAEIIKHACIKDAAMFRELENNDLAKYQKNKKLAAALIQRNVILKTRVVQKDEFETSERKLLNFGHTLGHALENQYELSHGEAISIGMTFASMLSQELLGFKNADRVIRALERYELPTFATFNKNKVIKVLKMDKKKSRDAISFILLEKLGRATIQQIAIDHIYQFL